MDSVDIGGTEFFGRAGVIAQLEVFVRHHRVLLPVDKKHRHPASAEGCASRIVDRKALEQAAVYAKQPEDEMFAGQFRHDPCTAVEDLGLEIFIAAVGHRTADVFRQRLPDGAHHRVAAHGPAEERDLPVGLAAGDLPCPVHGVEFSFVPMV